MRTMLLLALPVRLAMSCAMTSPGGGCAFGGWDCLMREELCSFGEPALSSADRDGEQYRLLFVGSMSRPWSVEVEPTPRGWDVVAKVLGRHPGRVVLLRSHEVLSTEADGVRRLLDDAGFWSEAPPAHAGAPEIDPQVWIIEGVRAGQHRIVRLTSNDFSPDAPARNHAFRRVGLALLRVGGLDAKSALLPGESLQGR